MSARPCVVCGGAATTLITAVLSVVPGAYARPVRFHLCEGCKRANPQPRKQQLSRRTYSFIRMGWIRIEAVGSSEGEIADRQAAETEAKYAPRMRPWADRSA